MMQQTYIRNREAKIARALRVVRGPLLALALAILVLAPAQAPAYFDRMEVGGRALSMGSAFHAIADDPSAIYWNPGGLGSQKRVSLLFNHYRPYLINDLAVNYLAASYPTRFGTVAASWHHLGLADVQSEDAFSLAWGGRTELPGIGDVGIGAAAKVLRVSYSSFTTHAETFDYGSQTKVALDIGALYRPHAKVAVGATLRNLGNPEFDFVDGNGGSPVDTEFESGLAYYWNASSVVSIGTARNKKDELAINIGGEVRFYDVFALRSGLLDDEFWGGFGLLAERWELDTGFVTHKTLGVSFTSSLTIPIGGER